MRNWSKHSKKEGLEEAGGLTWHNGVHLGLIHWSEWAKPWHHQSSVWRAGLWQAERTTWEQLRLAQWEKPLALLIRGDYENPIYKPDNTQQEVRVLLLGV